MIRIKRIKRLIEQLSLLVSTHLKLRKGSDPTFHYKTICNGKQVSEAGPVPAERYMVLGRPMYNSCVSYYHKEQ